MTTRDYWEEVLAIAAEECELTLTEQQLACLAEAADGAHEHYGMSFYSPPSTDLIEDIKREYEAKIKAKDRELERYRDNAETAVKLALRQQSDARVTIGERGEVFRHCGRTEQLQ